MHPPLSSSQSPLSSVSACGENCARSLAPQGHFRAHSVGLGAPPLPTARGAAGAPLGLARKENGPYPQGVCRIRKRQSRQRLRDCTVQKKRPLWSRSGTFLPPRCTGVGVSVQAPIWAGLRARYDLLRFLILPSRGGWCRPCRGGHRIDQRRFPLPLTGWRLGGCRKGKICVGRWIEKHSRGLGCLVLLAVTLAVLLRAGAFPGLCPLGPGHRVLCHCL